MTPELLPGEEETVYGDSGNVGAEKREDAIVRNKKGKNIRYQINRRPSQIKKLSKSGQLSQEKGARKIVRPRQGGASLWCGEMPVKIQEDPIPRFAKTGRQIQYHVCAGESDSG